MAGLTDRSEGFDSPATHTPTLYRGVSLECGRRFPNLWLAVSQRMKSETEPLAPKGEPRKRLSQVPEMLRPIEVGWWTTKVVGRKTTLLTGCPLFEMMNNSQPLPLMGVLCSTGDSHDRSINIGEGGQGVSRLMQPSGKRNRTDMRGGLGIWCPS